MHTHQMQWIDPLFSIISSVIVESNDPFIRGCFVSLDFCAPFSFCHTVEIVLFSYPIDAAQLPLL